MARCLVLLSLLTAAARADYEETERRLKRAGADAQLRKRIHDSIRRGARWLVARQRGDGSFRRDMVTLCGLALQHAAVPEAQAAYKQALAVILTSDGRMRERYYRSTYVGGFAALLLHAEGKRTKILHRLGAAFAYGEGGRGFWGYSNAALKGRGAGNLSTSQFAVLALWAAGRAGYHPKPDVWKRHVEYLIRSQTLDGSFGYGTAGMSYPTGTFMGLANLIVARDALARHLDAKLRKRIDTAQQQAEAILPRDVHAVIAAFRSGRVRDYYALYALEKVCLFLDREEVGGVRWYVEGARGLLQAQKPDGRWSGKDYRYWLYGSRAGPSKRPAQRGRTPTRDMEATAFALLFLLRSWESFHPTTPRDVHSPTTTPTAPAGPGPKSAPAEPARTRIPLALAQNLLDELAQRLRQHGGTTAALMAALRNVGDAYARLDAEPAKADAWRRRAEALLLRAFGRGPSVSVVAARILGGTNRRVAPDMMRIADRIRFPQARHAHDSSTYAAVFDALARLDAPGALRWMLDKHLVSTGAPSSTPRCRAALRAAVRFKRVSGDLRLAIVKRLVQGYLSMERSAPTMVVPAELKGTWKDLGPSVIIATQHFARDTTGLPPISRGVTGGWIFTMREFEQWLRENDDPKKPPWE